MPLLNWPCRVSEHCRQFQITVRSDRQARLLAQQKEENVECFCKVEIHIKDSSATRKRFCCLQIFDQSNSCLNLESIAFCFSDVVSKLSK